MPKLPDSVIGGDQVNIKRSSASRGELTKAMSATLREVRLHHQQIAAALAGIQQLMDGQAALGEEFKALKKRLDAIESLHGGTRYIDGLVEEELTIG